MLNRDYFINKLDYFTNDWKIKSLIGIRGSGKTFIIQQLMKKLVESEKADNEHIIYINFEYLEFENLRNIKNLKTYILDKIKDTKRYYLFLDEIYHVMHFESLLRYFWMYKSNISMYISCSNSRILPPDLHKILKYNYMPFYITPLTYSEYCELFNMNIKDKSVLLNYMKYGGFPGRFRFKKSSEVKDYLYSLLDLSYLKDIVMRLGVRDINELNCVLRYIIKYLGKKFAAYKVKIEAEENEGMHPEAFYTYLDSLTKALVIQESRGYNVKNNRILYGIFRYYIADFGFAFINGFDPTKNMEGALKNLVWLELKRKGYDVYTGMNGSEYIDLVAIHEKRIMYIQVVYLFEDGNDVNKQVAKFDDFEALGPKYILSLDKREFAKNGVIHRNIIEFLTDKSIEIELKKDEIIKVR